MTVLHVSTFEMPPRGSWRPFTQHNSRHTHTHTHQTPLESMELPAAVMREEEVEGWARCGRTLKALKEAEEWMQREETKVKEVGMIKATACRGRDRKGWWGENRMKSSEDEKRIERGRGVQQFLAKTYFSLCNVFIRFIQMWQPAPATESCIFWTTFKILMFELWPSTITTPAVEIFVQ